MVSTLGEPSAEGLARYGVGADHLLVKGNSGQLAEIAGLIDAGQVRPSVAMVLPLSDARKAHELSQTGHVRGKLVLKIR